MKKKSQSDTGIAKGCRLCLRKRNWLHCMWLQEAEQSQGGIGQCLLSIHFLLGCCQHPDFPVGSIPPLFSAPGALSAQSGQEIRTAEQCLVSLAVTGHRAY